MKKLILAAALIITGTFANAGTLNKYESKAMMSLLEDYGVQAVQQVEIRLVDTGFIRCEKAPVNFCIIQQRGEDLTVKGSHAQTLARLLDVGGASQDNSNVPATVTAASVSCVAGGIIRDQLGRITCTVTPAVVTN